MLVLFVAVADRVLGQEEPADSGMRGSIVEDRAARALLEAGSARYDADEAGKAVEVWQSVIERYPRSRVRFGAHMLLGDYFLERDRSFDRARLHFEAVTTEENRDEEQRAEAALKVGVCHYHAHSYGKSFQVLRDVIAQYPVSPQVNEAYYYIGLGHFQLGHYSRAISALEKVGTTLSDGDQGVEKLEAGKRLFVKIEDADLAVLGSDDAVEVRCEATNGDVETLNCYPVGRNVRLVLGSIPTRLGRPVPDSGELEVKGDDKVTVTYTDQHTADEKVDQKILAEVTVVGSANVQITDGAFSEPLRGVVLGKGVNVQVADADRDLTDNADSLQAAVEVHRLKTDEELEAETIEAMADAGATEGTDAETGEDETPKLGAYKRIDGFEISLVEAKVQRSLSGLTPSAAPEQEAEGQPEAPAAETVAADEPSDAAPSDVPAAEPAAATGDEPVEDDSVHSGVFRAVVTLEKAEEVVEGDSILQAQPGDMVRIVYIDERHRGEGVNQVHYDARCLEGNIGGVRVTRAVITDEELRIQTKLKTASALTNIGNRYKEFGLKENAQKKYDQALDVCGEIMGEARKLGGQMLEQTYVQLWHIYFEMDQLNMAAAMCQRLQREFPESGFLDDALLQLAEVARKQGDLNRAIGIYTRLVRMPTSQLRGEAQYGVAACYEQRAEETEGPSASQLRDRAFQEYKRVYEEFPDSGRVGEAVAKMAKFYYEQKDYSRAIDTFETVLSSYPDAKFMDVILFNYGRCLFRMGRKADARQRFDQLIAEFPDSPMATDAKKISEALTAGP
ncbi:MAG: tetratricopeptide repeat protein [Planctomycetes bacterium]|nr:tetratricopeptide repeat protein [Planctomycetota bacterium]MBL7042558.1 tetratricopeptide repeat protein [Pirellulaceae bacterium]